MADGSTSERSMRKAVERVDVGVFGLPLRLSAWRRARRQTWGGLAALSAGQAAAGAVLAVLFGLSVGIPLNVLSTILLVCFMVGCAVGGPVAFSIWSLLLIGVTGVIAGVVGGAWIASPQWWRGLAASWNAGRSVPGWFMVALPAWILFWTATSYAVSRGVDKLAERLALRIGFGAASRYAGEDERLRAEAFEESDLSPAESQSVLDRDDGMGTVVAIEKPTVEQGVRLEKSFDMGGEDSDVDTSAPPSPIGAGGKLDFGAMLDDDMDDPDVRRAAGISSIAVETEDHPEELREEFPDIPADDQAARLAVPITAGVPLVPPAPEKAPEKVVQTPRTDAMSNRSMMRRLTQLVLAFNTAEFENDTERFLEENEDEFARMSDEQMRMLAAIDNAGPLVAFAASIKESRMNDFMLGRADPPVPAGTGAFDPTRVAAEVPTPVVAAVQVASETRTSDVADAQEEDADMVETAVPAGDLASMASDFSRFMRRGGGRGAAASTDAVPTDAGGRMPVDAVASTAAAVQAVEPAAERATSAVIDHGADAAQSDGDNDGGGITATGAHGEVVRFEVDETPPAPSAEAATGEIADATTTEGDDDGDLEDEMNALVFSRSVCRQVQALVTGPLDVNEKATDVTEFERLNPGVMVAQVVASRSFDEFVGASEAVAGRHAWKEIQLILAQSSVDRLVSEFNRLNDRGRRLLEEPHTLTLPVFHVFETESVRLRQAAGANDETMARTMDLYQMNTDIESSLRRHLAERADAAERRRTAPPEVVVEDAAVVGDPVRGRAMFGSMLPRARDAGLGGVLAAPRPSEASRMIVDAVAVTSASTTKPASEEDDVDDVPTHHGQSAPIAAKEEPLNANDTSPRLGEDGYVSPHAPGTPEHESDMEDHEVLVRARTERRQREAARIARQAQADREAADAAEKLRQKEAQDLKDREEKEREDQRRADAAADEAVLADQRAAAAADKERADLDRRRAEREEARSQEDQRILEAHRARQSALRVPERFATPEVTSAIARLAELRDVRQTLMTSRVGIVPTPGMPEALSSPSVRSRLMIEVEMGKCAGVVNDAVVSTLGIAADSRPQSVLEALVEPAEIEFFRPVSAALDSSTRATQALEGAEEFLKGLSRAAADAAALPTVRETAETARRDADAAAVLAADAAAVAEAQKARADAADAELVSARAELAALRRTMAGIVDDDFQRLLDASAEKVTDTPVDGFYMLSSPTGSSIVLIATFPASQLPEGMVKAGNTLRPLDAEISYLMNKARTRETEHMEFLYTDLRIRAYVDVVQGIVSTHLPRDVAQLRERLGPLEIEIGGE